MFKILNLFSCLVAVVSVVVLSSSVDAVAARGKTISREVDIGIRYMVHYNHLAGPAILPGAMLAELQYSSRLNNSFRVFVLGGKTVTSLSGVSGAEIGTGVEVSWLQFVFKNAWIIQRYRISVLADVTLYQLGTSDPSQAYPYYNLTVRYGPMVELANLNIHTVLRLAGEIGRVNGSLFIAPLVGIGYEF